MQILSTVHLTFCLVKFSLSLNWCWLKLENQYLFISCAYKDTRTCLWGKKWVFICSRVSMLMVFRKWSALFPSESVIGCFCYTLNSLSLFWLAESVQWIFEISTRDVITADYIIIMSRTFKVRGYHVMYDRSAWFLRVIMSCSRTLCCLRSVKKQNMTSIFFNV